MRTRAEYGRRLEPQGNRILHGAGQDPQGFADYRAALPGQAPLISMQYAGLRHFERPKVQAALLARLDDPIYAGTIPQVGLSMCHDGQPELHYEAAVAAGDHDAAIAGLVDWLRALDRPLYLRLGYEFNGKAWNGYEAPSYVAAWQRVVAAIRAAGLDQVATVWCYAPEGSDKDFMSYYPGDDVVDWWSLDPFDVEHCSAPDTLAFLAAAAAAERPVMLGETTPRHVGVADGLDHFRRWGDAFWGLIAAQPGIKAFCYINWNWLGRRDDWNDWGDGRIEQDPAIRDWWSAQLAQPSIQHQAPPADWAALMHGLDAAGLSGGAVG